MNSPLKTLSFVVFLVAISSLLGWRTGQMSVKSCYSAHILQAIPSGGSISDSTETVDHTIREDGFISDFKQATDIFSGKKIAQTQMLPQIRQMARLVVSLSKFNLTQRKDILEKLSASSQVNRDGVAGLSYLALSIGGGDPTDAADEFEKLAAQPNIEQEKILTAAIPYISSDPAGFIARISREFKNGARPPAWCGDELVNFAVRALGSNDLRQAMSAAQNFPKEATRPQLVDAASYQLSTFFNSDKSLWPADANELVTTVMIHGGGERDNILLRILSARMAAETPQDALAWLQSLELPAEQQQLCQKAMTKAWANRAPADAYTWRLERTPVEQRPKMLETTINDWTYANENEFRRKELPAPDLSAAADWLNAQHPGPEAAAALKAMAKAWLNAGELTAAKAWADSIQDDAMREQALKEIHPTH